jgi:hypothetical protein
VLNLIPKPNVLVKKVVVRRSIARAKRNGPKRLVLRPFEMESPTSMMSSAARRYHSPVEACQQLHIERPSGALIGGQECRKKLEPRSSYPLPLWINIGASARCSAEIMIRLCNGGLRDGPGANDRRT